MAHRVSNDTRVSPASCSNSMSRRLVGVSPSVVRKSVHRERRISGNMLHDRLERVFTLTQRHEEIRIVPELCNGSLGQLLLFLVLEHDIIQIGLHAAEL